MRVYFKDKVQRIKDKVKEKGKSIEMWDVRCEKPGIRNQDTRDRNQEDKDKGQRIKDKVKEKVKSNHEGIYNRSPAMPRGVIVSQNQPWHVLR